MRVNFPVWLSDAHSSSSFELSENHGEKVETWELQGRGCQRALPGPPRQDSAPPLPFQCNSFFPPTIISFFSSFFWKLPKEKLWDLPLRSPPSSASPSRPEGRSSSPRSEMIFSGQLSFCHFFYWISLKFQQHFFDNFESTCFGCYLVRNTNLMICLFWMAVSIEGIFVFFLLFCILYFGWQVVPESCQRTDGIKAWLETKEEREERQFRNALDLYKYFSFL